MIALCRKAREVRGEVAGVVTGEVRHPFKVLNGEHGRQEHQERLRRKGEDILRTVNLLTALELRAVATIARYTGYLPILSGEPAQ